MKTDLFRRLKRIYALRGARASVVLAVMATILISSGFAVSVIKSSNEEAENIRERYRQLRFTLSSGDTNAAKALVILDRRRAADHWFGILRTFAKPLGNRSDLRFSNSYASICPERVYHYRVIPGGHSIDMVKVGGDWFFTGVVDID